MKPSALAHEALSPDCGAGSQIDMESLTWNRYNDDVMWMVIASSPTRSPEPPLSDGRNATSMTSTDAPGVRLRRRVVVEDAESGEERLRERAGRHCGREAARASTILPI